MIWRETNTYTPLHSNMHFQKQSPPVGPCDQTPKGTPNALLRLQGWDVVGPVGRVTKSSKSSGPELFAMDPKVFKHPLQRIRPNGFLTAPTVPTQPRTPWTTDSRWETDHGLLATLPDVHPSRDQSLHKAKHLH